MDERPLTGCAEALDGGTFVQSEQDQVGRAAIWFALAGKQQQILDSPISAIFLWLLALGTSADLAYGEYKSVASPIGEDFHTFFQAGQAVASGHTPYSIHSYVYPPLFAFLLAPVSHLPQIDVYHWWIALSLAAVAATGACVVWTNSHRIRPWHAPVLFGFCTITGLHFYPLTVELRYGQSDMFVLITLLLACAAAIRGHNARSGVFVGVAGLLKAWPAAIALFFFRRDAGKGRERSLLAFVLTLVAAPVIALSLGGWSGLASMVRNILTAGEGRRVVEYSVWEVPNLIFGYTTGAQPVVLSPVLHGIAIVVLLFWTLALLVVTLRQRQVDPAIAFWNVVLCVVLLVPLSHLVYTLYALPILWYWAVRVLRPPTARRDVLLSVFVLLLLWWLAGLQSWYGTPPQLSTSSLEVSVPFFTNLAACTVSVLGLSIVDSGRLRVGLMRSSCHRFRERQGSTYRSLRPQPKPDSTFDSVPPGGRPKSAS